MKAMRWPAGSAAVVAGLLLAGLLVAGCGGGGSGTATTGGSSPAGVAASAGPPPDAAALGEQMKSAMAKATGVHILAVVTQDGAKISVDMSMTRAGDVSGTASANRVSFTMLVTQGHAYIKISSGLLKSQNLPAASCTLICGKYLEVPTGQAKGMLNGMDMSSLLGQASAARLTYVRTVTVNGQPAWQMRGQRRKHGLCRRPGTALPVAPDEGAQPGRLHAVELRDHSAPAARQPGRGSQPADRLSTDRPGAARMSVGL